MKHGVNWAGLVWTGPAVFVFLLACLALTVLVSSALRRTESLLALGDRAQRRLDRGGTLPTLWGLSAAVLAFAVSAILVQTHVLALLGVLLLAAGVCLAGVGLGVVALRLGGLVAPLLGAAEGDLLAALRLGLALLFWSAWLPFLGWVTALLAVAAGIGAVLEALFTRDRAA